VTDFLEAAQPCPPGKGCKGGDADVPTSVIFPYQRPDNSVEDRAARSAGVDPLGVYDEASDGQASHQKPATEDFSVCTCMLTKQKMLQALEEGMERERPGRLEALRKARETREKHNESVWTKLNLHNETSEPTFSFGF